MRSQAVEKSGVFRSAVDGEWSETMQSIVPSASPSPQRVLVGGLADGRAALELSGAVGHFLRGEGQEVRAGLGRDPDAPRRGPRR